METVLISYKAKVEGPRVSVHLLPRTVAGDIVERDAINVSETFGQAFIALTSDMCLFDPMLMLGLMLGKYREALILPSMENWSVYSQETGGKNGVDLEKSWEVIIESQPTTDERTKEDCFHHKFIKCIRQSDAWRRYVRETI